MDPEGFGDEWADEWDGESQGGDPESSDQVMDPLFAPQDFICDEDDDDDLAPVGNHDDAELDGEPCFSVQKGMWFFNPNPEVVPIRKLWGINMYKPCLTCQVFSWKATIVKDQV